ncbi:NUDIX hydrolase [Negadavirga shengliensis]|uniref:NUDIX hydrolase n=1 Tax=Negadavirga shengliensis TaxID=1389218 RepID=A0ABV9T7V1_9BACT
MDHLLECFYRVSVKALVLDDGGRFMLVKEDNGLWELPGGGLDHGETPHEALKREIKEEMGLETLYIADQPCYFFTSLNPKGVFVANVLYETRLAGLNFIPSTECTEIRFFSATEALDENHLYPNVEKFARIYSYGPG